MSNFSPGALAEFGDADMVAGDPALGLAPLSKSDENETGGLFEDGMYVAEASQGAEPSFGAEQAFAASKGTGSSAALEGDPSLHSDEERQALGGDAAGHLTQEDIEALLSDPAIPMALYLNDHPDLRSEVMRIVGGHMNGVPLSALAAPPGAPGAPEGAPGGTPPPQGAGVPLRETQPPPERPTYPPDYDPLEAMDPETPSGRYVQDQMRYLDEMSRYVAQEQERQAEVHRRALADAQERERREVTKQMLRLRGATDEEAEGFMHWIASDDAVTLDDAYRVYKMKHGRGDERLAEIRRQEGALRGARFQEPRTPQAPPTAGAPVIDPVRAAILRLSQRSNTLDL